jgi:hypothetical protein
MKILTHFAIIALILTSAGGTAMARPIHDHWYQDIETPYQGFSPNSTKGSWAFWDNMNGVDVAH